MKDSIRNNIVTQIQSFKDSKDLTIKEKRKIVKGFGCIIIL